MTDRPICYLATIRGEEGGRLGFIKMLGTTNKTHPFVATGPNVGEIRLPTVPYRNRRQGIFWHFSSSMTYLGRSVTIISTGDAV